MKRILTRIFSVALAATTSVSPVLAQTAKKAVAAGAESRKASVAVKAQPAMARANDAKKLDLKARTVSSGFRSERKSFGAPPVRTVSKAAGDMPTIYGSVIFNDKFTEESSPVGLYEVPKSAGATTQILPGPNAQYGGVCVDGIYYASSYFNLWGMVFITVQAYDVEAGESVKDWSPNDLAVIAPGGYALDPASGQVYGITYNSAGDGRQLSKISFGDEVTSTAVAPIDGNWNSIAFDAAGQLYGISYTGEAQGDNFVVTSSALNKIDKNTGAVTTVGETGVAPQYMSGSVIDPKTGRMFWNVCPSDECGYMYEVNLQTGHADLLYQLDDNDEIMGMYLPAPAAELTAPGECKGVSFNFEKGSLSGTCTLTTPSTLFDGTTPGSGELFVKVLANGDIVAGGEPQSWGQQITIPVDLSLKGAGMYDFIVFASGDGGDGPKTRVKNVYVGADTPRATTATLSYDNGRMQVAWDAVTASVNGGYLDLGNLTYKVVRADGTVAAEGLAATSFSEAVAYPDQLTMYYYQVYAVCNGMTSAEARTNTVTLGEITPPYQPDFTADGLSGWTLIDGNEDSKVWTVWDDAVRMAWNSSKDMDDWMITPPVKMEAGKAYLVRFEAKCYGASYPERLEVKYGKNATVAGMTGTLVEPVDITSDVYTEFSEYLVPDADGVYYIGFHGISDPNMYYLYVRNVRIDAGVSALAPGSVTDLQISPDLSGALKANVSFKAPSKTMNGQTLSSLTKVEVLRGGTVIKTFDNPTPGAALSYDDILTEKGRVSYSVVGYNSVGVGVTASASAFIGFSTPQAPASASIVATAADGEVTVSWDAVTNDVNGKTLPADKVTYVIVDTDSNVVKDGLTSTSYTFQAVDAGKQDFVQYGVCAVMEDAIGDFAITDMIPVGTPYAGIEESFAGAELGYIWGLSAIGGGKVQICNEESFTDINSQDNDGGFVVIFGDYLDTGADFFSGLVSISDMVNPALSFYTYNIVGDDINEITISVREKGQTDYTVLRGPSQVCELVPDADWGKVSVSLDAYAGKVIQFRITGLVKKYKYTMLDNIRVGSTLDHDLKAAGIAAPATVNTGSDYTVEVTVANDGAKKADSYSVELYADEELVATQECGALESEKRAAVKFGRTMSALATDPVVYHARIVYAADEDLNNNQTSKVTVVPSVSTLPVAVNLAGASADGGVKLTWSEPSLEGDETKPVTDDFEDYESFAINDAGDWTFIDGDGSATYAIQDVDAPNLGEAMAYIVLDASHDGFNESFAAHSGNKYLASFAAESGLNDDWMISPELDGGKQTVTFFAKTYTDRYGAEAFEFLYSTSGKDRSDFIKLDGDSNVPTEWTEYSYELPAGARYFAIRCVSPDRFIFLVDDVTYVPAGSTANLEIAGYNVYRDGVRINEALVEETEFVDNNVAEGEEYTYVVTVVYKERGESAASDEVVIRYSGVDGIGDGAVSITVSGNDIVVLNAEGLDVAVSAASGAVIYSGAGERRSVIKVGSGVYVVTAGKTVRKVIVR